MKRSPAIAAAILAVALCIICFIASPRPDHQDRSLSEFPMRDNVAPPSPDSPARPTADVKGVPPSSPDSLIQGDFHPREYVHFTKVGNTSEPVSNDEATNSVKLWDHPKNSRGQKLDPNSVATVVSNGPDERPKGRWAEFESVALAPLGKLRRGDSVVLPLFDGEQVIGQVNLAQTETTGTTRIGGALTGQRTGSFSLATNGKKTSAMILMPMEKIAIVISESRDGQLIFQEKHLSEVICFPLPLPKDEPISELRNWGPQGIPPIHSSRPTAAAVLYLDFDGETVTDADWNGGNTIVAQPSSLSNSEITEVWNRVKEDFWPFNIDVTTDRSRYNNAQVGSRMRCIITPTNTAAPGFGGIAFLRSFDQAGKTFSSTIPCWVFIDSGAKSVAEAVSHELGHTFGLNHDGRTSPVEGYYEGHGSGAVGWAPIMGLGYYKELTQWSKGEYQFANNNEDDVAIISNATNGFGYVADEAGGAIGNAAALNVPAGNVNQAGVITTAGDSDFFTFNTTGGSVTINASNASPFPNLDIALEILNSSGNVVSSNNPASLLSGGITASLGAGTYYVRISGSGAGDPFTTGYSSYGSIGAYALTGTVPGGGVNVFLYVDNTRNYSNRNGSPEAPFLTIADAINAAQPGSGIRIFGSHYPPAITTNKILRLERWERPGEPSGIVTIGQ